MTEGDRLELGKRTIHGAGNKTQILKFAKINENYQEKTNRLSRQRDPSLLSRSNKNLLLVKHIAIEHNDYARIAHIGYKIISHKLQRRTYHDGTRRTYVTMKVSTLQIPRVTMCNLHIQLLYIIFYYKIILMYNYCTTLVNVEKRGRGRIIFTETRIGL